MRAATLQGAQAAVHLLSNLSSHVAAARPWRRPLAALATGNADEALRRRRPWSGSRACSGLAFNLDNPRATFKYKNARYADHLALLERYKAEVLEAARAAQAPPKQQHGGGAAPGPSTEQQREFSETRRELAEQKRHLGDTMRDPAKKAAFEAAVKEYQEQFNHTVEIELRNGRALAGSGLDTSGFALLDHPSAVREWDDAEHVQAIYYAEMRALVQRLTGATRCFVNRHNIRKSDGTTKFKPFMEVHSDFTDNYKAALVRSLLAGKEETPTFGMLDQLQREGVSADELRRSRLLVIHAWRNVSNAPLRRFPLALCDARSVGEAELIRETVSGLERYRAMHSPSHRWYWFPDMMRDEVLLFKGFDSEQKRYAFHSAFVHPDTCEADAHRFSCELRLICMLPE